jgi:4-carboxymuconolactone decarboxylase
MSGLHNLYETDPEFMERFDAFALREVVNEPGQQLDNATRYIAILATLIGCQGVDEYETTLQVALESALNPVMVKEIVYQSVAYPDCYE